MYKHRSAGARPVLGAAAQGRRHTPHPDRRRRRAPKDKHSRTHSCMRAGCNKVGRISCQAKPPRHAHRTHLGNVLWTASSRPRPHTRLGRAIWSHQYNSTPGCVHQRALSLCISRPLLPPGCVHVLHQPSYTRIAMPPAVTPPPPGCEVRSRRPGHVNSNAPCGRLETSEYRQHQHPCAVLLH